MCGIAGKVYMDRSQRVERTEIERMIDIMRYRGPDGQGIFTEGAVGLGHLRLSIIDLASGSQPISNEDNSIWIVFNGEIYNYRGLRERLIARGHRFKTQSDTEVIIHLYEEQGDECVKELRGMFAFAIWDARRQRLFLARDRVGIKPLYYCEQGGVLWFASEIKAILTSAEVSRDVNLGAIGTFLTHFYVPGEQTLFGNVRRLLPGHTLVVENGGITRRSYWDLHFPKERSQLSFEDAASELRELIGRRVLDHMISDVPVGFLASGGMDSTALLSLAEQQTNKQIQTFTVGFEGQHFADERPFARMAAERFGARHHEITVSADQFRQFLPSYVWHMEDPVCEPPAVALHFVSKLARSHVKVLLSGEGGDEAFAGYPNYRSQLFVERVKQAGNSLTALAAGGLTALSHAPSCKRLRYYGNVLASELGSHYWSRTSSPWSYFYAKAADIFEPDYMKTAMPAGWPSYVTALYENAGTSDPLSRMLYVDTKSWLPDDLLIKADKITMGNSLELRVPLLDHEVLEFAARLPSSYKVRGMETKRVLKRAFRDLVPPEILNRKKAGFPVPYERWLRQDLRSFVQDTVRSERALSRGYFRKAALTRLLDDHASTGGLSKEVFCLLVLELWHRRFVDETIAHPPSSMVQLDSTSECRAQPV